MAALLACAALTGGLLQATPASADPGHRDAKKAAVPTSTGGVRNPDKRLGKGWKSSTDRAVTSAADAGGLKILVADSAKAYAWKTAAILSEPGMPADSWIGNTCVMDHSHAAVAYAPRTFTNKPDLMQGGAFTAVIDLDTGQVTKLPFTASLAYFDPSCNPDTHTAAFTAFRDDRTRLVTVDTTGKTTADATAAGQVTSAVPVRGGALAARGPHLVHVDRTGKVEDLAATDGVPFEIRPLGDKTVAFLDHTADTARAKLWRGHGRPAVAASGRLGDLSLKQGEGRRVFLTGNPTGTFHAGGTGVVPLRVPADADVSTQGRLAVDPVLTPGMNAGLNRIKYAGKGFTKDEPLPGGPTRGGTTARNSTAGEPVTVTSTATVTKQKITQTVTGNTGQQKPVLSPSLSDAVGAHTLRATAAAGVSQTPVDTDRWCSVPRNDVNAQALQPTPNQVEWAVDMAVRGELHANWINQGGWRAQTGLGTIDPQKMFPPPTLTGGGRIPAQVMLGVLAQESNLWQAESGAIPGQMGNPLAATAGFYGHKGSDPSDYWKIHWDKSDCGYGVGQVTDGMRLAGHEKPGEKGLPLATQKAVALDYTVNVAASMYILADKWNELHTSGQTITVNNDDSSRPENWFAALWNYNLGFNKVADASKNNGHWGLGWYNNPANPLYPPSRLPFMDTSVDPNANHDAAHPQDWPYEEKVMGWSAWSIDTGHSYSTDGRQDWPGESGFSSAGFRPSWWVDAGQRAKIKPPLDAFCNTANHCNASSPPDCPDATCYQQYWWNGKNVTWKSDCDTSCGHENIKYATLRAEPGRGYRLQYGTPVCSGAPSGSLVVESVPAGTDTWSDCGKTKSDGSFQFSFQPDSDGQYEAKGDLHQIGGGYGGHFWYAHSRDAAHLGGPDGPMTVLGSWKLTKSVSEGQAMVYAHIPDTGAQTKQAVYEIVTPFGTRKKTIDQDANASGKWVPLGAYRFNDQIPEVRLSNTNSSGDGNDDIAWDAVAFVPGDYGVSATTGDEPYVIFPGTRDTTSKLESVQGPIDARRNIPSLTARGRNTASTSCAKQKDGKTYCARFENKSFSSLSTAEQKHFLQSERRAQRRNLTSRAGTLPDDLVAWCQASPVGKDRFTRSDACVKNGVLAVTYATQINGTSRPIATLTFGWQMDLLLDAKSTQFKQQLKMWPDNIKNWVTPGGSKDMGLVSFKPTFTCGPDCAEGSPQWFGGTPAWNTATWDTASPDTHTVIATFTNEWTASSTSTQQLMGMEWKYDGDITPTSGNVIKTGASLGDATPDLEIRCDKEIKNNGYQNGGCTFLHYTPTFTVDTNKNPAAGAYYWLMMDRLPSHPGSKKARTPLHYYGPNTGGGNRNVVCETDWKGGNPATPDASCDEYAPAATYESGGYPGGSNEVTSGAQCAQLFVSPEIDGSATWGLYPDTTYGPAPTLNEKCGRASIPTLQNTDAFNRVSRVFRPRMRLLDGDAYYVSVPGFEHCTTGQLCRWKQVTQ